MSVEAIHWAKDISGLSMLEGAVLNALAVHADRRTGEAWPSQSRIAEICRCTVRSVQRAIKSLEAKGLLTRSSRYRDDGGRTSDLITLACVKMAGVASDPPRHSVVSPPDRMSPPPRHSVAYPPDTVSGQERSYERSSERKPRSAAKYVPTLNLKYAHPGASPWASDEERGAWNEICLTEWRRLNAG